MESIDPNLIQTAQPWSLWVGDLGRFFVLLAIGCFAVSALGWSLAGLGQSARAKFGWALSILVIACAGLAFKAVGPDFHFQTALAVVGGLSALLLAYLGLRSVKAGSAGAAIPARAFIAGSVALIATLVCLGILFVSDQFHYAYLWPRASLATELKYKIAGIWSGQEGSFLLWACMSAVFGILGARAAGIYRRWFTVCYALFLMALAAILAYESPFKIDPVAWEAAGLAGKSLPLVPLDGQGMTPSLQNYWVVIHPPTIFAGFGALTLLFCWAMSAMLTGNVKDWAAMVRPWALATLAILGLGLCMGGFWAYETLGWGGFWAWDPVENVSFVPWCFAAALIHGLIVQTTRGRWIGTNLLLAGLPFVLFVYGTFMTRSGFLDDSSVHSFAEMNRSALLILVGIMFSSLLAFLGVWLFRGLRQARETREFVTVGIHREGVYRSGMILLAALGVSTAAGMSVPLIQALGGGTPKAVGEQSYHLIITWFFVPLMILLAVGPFISWRGMPLRELGSKTLNVFSVSLGLVGVCLLVAKSVGWAPAADDASRVLFPMGLRVPLFPWMLFLIWLTAFVGVANLWRIVEVWRKRRDSVGAFISHFGVAALMAGLIISRGFEQKSQVAFVRPGEPAAALDFVVDYLGKTDEQDRYNRNNRLLFKVAGPAGSFQAQPGQYYVPARQEGGEDQQMSWPYIHHTLWHDIYFSTKEMESEGPPFPLHPGETHAVNDVMIRYDRLEISGQPGQKGTKFITHLTITDAKGTKRAASPFMELTDAGMSPTPAPLDDVLYAVPMGVRPDTKEALIQLRYLPTAYAVQMFYKPMTILVWTGAGILALGGLLAAWNRRRPGTNGPDSPDPIDPVVESKEDASAPTA